MTYGADDIGSVILVIGILIFIISKKKQSKTIIRRAGIALIVVGVALILPDFVEGFTKAFNEAAASV